MANTWLLLLKVGLLMAEQILKKLKTRGEGYKKDGQR